MSDEIVQRLSDKALKEWGGSHVVAKSFKEPIHAVEAAFAMGFKYGIKSKVKLKLKAKGKG